MIKRILLSAVILASLGAGIFAVAHARSHGPEGMMDGGHHMRLSPQERAEFAQKRLAALKTSLELTDEQEKLWPAVEATVKDNLKIMDDLVAKAKAAGRPADPIEGMRRMADMAAARAEGLRKLADAAQPLYASLTGEQKKRLPKLMHGWRG